MLKQATGRIEVTLASVGSGCLVPGSTMYTVSCGFLDRAQQSPRPSQDCQ